MRLHRLTMTAFGPFAGTVDIDFDAVSSAGLFLIRGATGAGKTSILDAVCFALYAAVPGARPGGRSLRSDHAPRDVVPTVTVEFTAAGRRFRVERSPEFLRPKKRGDGETKSPARVVLHERLGGTWVGRDTRHDDVAAVLTEVLGMGLEQFSKVVLLPQGEFAAFLRATPEARRELLERLFDVSSFAGVEEWLAGERRRTSEVVERCRAEVSTDLARLADAVADTPAELLETTPDWRELDPHEVPERLAQLRRGLEELAVTTLATLDRATGEAAAAAARRRSAEQALVLQATAARAATELAALDEGRALHERARATLAVASRAATVSGDLKAVERAAGEVVRATARATDTGAALSGFGLADRSADSVAQWSERLHAGEAGVAEAARLARAAADKAERWQALRRQVAAAEAQALELAAALEHADVACAAAERDLARTKEAAASLDGLRAGAESATSLLALREAHDRGEAEREVLTGRIAAARTHEQDLRQDLLDLREARLTGMAGELAEALSVGSPCPVCGSCAHPVPATRATVVTTDDLSAADDRWTTARGALDVLERELVAADTAAASREALLDGDQRGVDELRQVAGEARTAVAAALATAARLGSAAEALERARAERGRVASRADLLRESLLTTSATADELERGVGTDADAARDLLEEHERLCPCADPARVAGTVHRDASAAHDTPGDRGLGLALVLDQVQARHRAVSAAADRHVTALRELTLAEQSHAAAVEALASSLADQGFDTADEARRGLVEEREVRRLEAACREYDRARTAAETVLSDPEVVAAAESPQPDLEALREAESSTHTLLRRAQDAETLARRTLAAVARLHPRLVSQCEAIGPAAAHHALVRDLADTFTGTGGNNALRMRLSSFVLAARLERVADLANERLALMGEGRYRLQHSDGLAARGARSGLGLRVLDLWTGQSRDTATLSGGEAFMASLALALGLADAVREESGGFDLQTLFVDEGFGTLDDESLEQVMAVLDSLREGGRAVGVVSHVAELRSRIPCQVTVDKTESGSTVRVAGGPATEPAA
jgi:exonuclease SbcC